MADLNPTIQALRPYLNQWGMDHPEEVLLVLQGLAIPPPPGVILAPNLYTRPQTARILECSPQAINDRIHRGTLPVETWWGVKMIPAAAVSAALRKKVKA